MSTSITETERLILRLPTLEDAEASFAIYSDPEVMKFIDGDEPFETIETARKSIANGLRHYEQHGVCHYAVELKETGGMIGHCGFNIFEQTDDLELVIHLNRAFWGQGYATEAGKAVITYAVNKLEPNRIVALVIPENLASKRLIERCGLSFLAKEVVNDYLLDVYHLTR